MLVFKAVYSGTFARTLKLKPEVLSWLATFLFHVVDSVYGYPLCSYDVVFTADATVILERFLDFNCSVVFSAEGFCWPDEDLAVSGLIAYRPASHYH